MSIRPTMGQQRGNSGLAMLLRLINPEDRSRAQRIASNYPQYPNSNRIYRQPTDPKEMTQEQRAVLARQQQTNRDLVTYGNAIQQAQRQAAIRSWYNTQNHYNIRRDILLGPNADNRAYGYH